MPEPTRHRSCAAAGRAVARICRQWTGGKTGVPVAAALVAALWLLPALLPALASPPRAAQYDAYPAVGWQEVDSIELRELKRTVAGTDNSDTIALFRRRQAPGAVINAKGDAFRWWAAPVSDEVRRLLPGVRFFHEEHHTYSNPDGPYHSAVALYRERRYKLQSLNKLLVDCGYKFDTSEVPAIARIAVLWTLLQQQAELRNERLPTLAQDRAGRLQPRPDSAALATAIPAVTFRKIERRPISVLVELDIAGKRTAVEVGLVSGTCMPQFMTRDGKPWGAWFNSPGFVPSKPQGRLGTSGPDFNAVIEGY